MTGLETYLKEKMVSLSCHQCHLTVVKNNLFSNGQYALFAALKSCDLCGHYEIDIGTHVVILRGRSRECQTA